MTFLEATQSVYSDLAYGARPTSWPKIGDCYIYDKDQHHWYREWAHNVVPHSIKPHIPIPSSLFGEWETVTHEQVQQERAADHEQHLQA